MVVRIDFYCIYINLKWRHIFGESSLIRMDLSKMSQQIIFEATAESAQMTSEWIVYNFRVDSAESLIRDHFFFRWDLNVIYVRLNNDRLDCQNIWNA